jgi:iron complex transport system substrate-binding protein
MSRVQSVGALAGVASLVLVLGVSGCGGEQRTPEPSPAERIIALAPGITETLFELGLGDRVVGVGDYSSWPIEAAQKPRLGGLFDARLEAISALQPDLAILLPSEEKLRLQLERLGVEVLTVRSETLAEVESMMGLIAERCGVRDRGEALRERWRKGLTPDPVAGSPRVLLAVGREPGRMADVLIGGPGTHLDELLGLLGVSNAFADAPLQYPQVNLEEILQRQAEVVIDLQPSPGSYEELVLDWRALAAETEMAPACARVVAGDHVLVPGPRLPRLYQELREAILSCGGKP